MGNYAGVDWASEKHDVLVADAAGERLLSATFAHDELGLRSLCRALVRLEVELVAIERPDGLLVERLLDAGLRILPLHPNQVAATRDRFRTSGGKSDRFDAFVLCELARTDHHRFRVLEPDSDQTKALRALTRAREDLVGTRTALTNQLRAELERFWPGPLGLFTDLHSRICASTAHRGLCVRAARLRSGARVRRRRYSGRCRRCWSTIRTGWQPHRVADPSPPRVRHRHGAVVIDWPPECASRSCGQPHQARIHGVVSGPMATEPPSGPARSQRQPRRPRHFAPYRLARFLLLLLALIGAIAIPFVLGLLNVDIVTDH